jgi:hypothetical protein
MKENEVGRHVARTGEKSLVGKPEGKNNLQDLGADGLTFKQMFKK